MVNVPGSRDEAASVALLEAMVLFLWCCYLDGCRQMSFEDSSVTERPKEEPMAVAYQDPW